MSPASDVYSLGIVLWQLLSDSLPYDVSGLHVVEAARVVRESELTRLGSIDGRLPGELETVTGKSLEKDPARRYANAGELAADLRRYLAGETIRARPPCALYRVRVFARRNKAVVAATAIVLGLLLVGFMVSTALYVTSERERADAEVLTSVLVDSLTSIDPEVARGREVTLREFVDDVVARLGTEIPLDEDSLSGARLRAAIGKTYRHIGEYEPARESLQTAVATYRRRLGSTDPETLEAVSQLGLVHYRRQEPDAFGACFLEVIRAHRSDDLPESAALAVSLRGYAEVVKRDDYAVAEALVREALEIFERLPGSQAREIAWCQTHIGQYRNQQGDPEGAWKWIERALKTIETNLGPDHPHVIYNLQNLGALSRSRGDLERALEYFERGADLARRILKRNPLVGRMFSEVLRTQRMIHGEDSLVVARAACDAAEIDLEAGRLGLSRRRLSLARSIVRSNADASEADRRLLDELLDRLDTTRSQANSWDGTLDSRAAPSTRTGEDSNSVSVHGIEGESP